VVSPESVPRWRNAETPYACAFAREPRAVCRSTVLSLHPETAILSEVVARAKQWQGDGKAGRAVRQCLSALNAAVPTSFLGASLCQRNFTHERICSMRQPIAKLVFFCLIVAVSLMVAETSAWAQGFLKRLQDRVQSREQENANSRDADATDPAGGGLRAAGDPRSGDPRSGARRPLVDVLLQYGPEIFGGGSSDNQSSSGSATSGRPTTNAVSVPAHSVAASSVAATGKASLGIDVLDSPPGVPGVLVTGFRNDSKAGDAGLQKDDVIVSLDQTLTPKIADIARLLSQRRPGQLVTARVLRGDSMKMIQIPLLGPPQVPVAPVPQPPLPRLGQSAARTVPVPATSTPETIPTSPLPENLPAPIPQRHSSEAMIEQYGIIPAIQSKLRGAVVEGVIQGSTAAAAGILPADRVVSVDGLLTRDARALSRQLTSLPDQSSASLGVVREGTYLIKPMLLTTEIQSASDSAGRGQTDAASADQDSTNQHAAGENGVLEGIGSVLGGLLGGSQKKMQGSPSNGSPTNGSPTAGKGGPETGPSTKPVQQSSFQQKVSGQLQRILGDPPSLNGLPVKPKSVTKDISSDEAPPRETAQTAAEMREQIRQLQEKVKRIEAEAKTQKKTAAEDPSSEADPN
jgi:membrane-associated protease RseP (regulator of RpoE activity)